MIRETTCHPTMIKHVETYLLSKPITKQQKRREGWAGLCLRPISFYLLFRNPLFKIQKNKAQSSLSPCTSYLNIITSHNTQRLFFLSSFLSLSLSFFLSLLSFLFLLHRCFYTKSIILFSKKGLFIHMAIKPSCQDRWYSVCSQKVDLGLSRIWVFI